MRDQVAGVIACAAGFPYADAPARGMRFAYFALAGVEDFNLIELHQLEERLAKADVRHQLLTFEGAHEWPSKTLLEEAVAWHEVMAFQMKLRPPDAALLNALYEQVLSRARSFDAASNPYESLMRYQMLATGFRGLRATTEADARLRDLQNAKYAQAQIDQLKAADRQQESRWRELLTITQGVKSADAQMQALVEGKTLVARLRKQSESMPPSTERMVARRLLGLFSVTVSEEASGEMYRKNYGVAAAFLTLAVELRPDNPQAFFRLAAARAQSGQKRLAMEALTRAVALGFNDAARLEQTEEFASLRQEKAFKEIIEKLRTNKL